VVRVEKIGDIPSAKTSGREVICIDGWRDKEATLNEIWNQKREGQRLDAMNLGPGPATLVAA
jgi:hypothetical protein